jgi:hypothetical protein
VVHGPVEEPLDLRGVQVDREDPVGTRGLVEVGDQPGGDRLPAPVLLVLPTVRVERQHHGDPLGGATLKRIHHYQ